MVDLDTTEEVIKDYASLIVPRKISGNVIQTRLVDGLLESSHLTRYPPSKSFQLQFFKSIISYLESNEEEVDPTIYDHYLDLLAVKPSGALNNGPPGPSYVTYFYITGTDRQSSRTITLLESRTTIEAGTTGLRTWQASFTFANWLLQHPDIVQGKRVLELGSGAGFLGILVGQLQIKNQSTSARSSIVLTDCNAEVLERCRLNADLSCNKLAEHASMTARPLDWNDCLIDSTERETAFAYLRDLDADVIIGADLVFDPSIIPALVATLALALRASASLSRRDPIEALIALAIRREATFEEFKTACENAGLTVQGEPMGGDCSGPFGRGTSGSTSLNVADHVCLLRISLPKGETTEK